MTVLPQPRRRTGCGRQLGGCLAVIALLFVFELAIGKGWELVDRWRFPWADATSGRPTLTGTWVGTLTTGGGSRIGLLLEMDLPSLEAGPRSRHMWKPRVRASLVGRALQCSRPGAVARFDAWGRPERGDATRFAIGFATPTGVTQPDGLAASHVRGTWDGAHTITGEADVHLNRGRSAISNSADPDTGRPARVQLKRGTEAELAAICARL